MKYSGRKKYGITSVTVAALWALGSPALAQPPTLDWSQTYSGLDVAEARGVAVDGAGVYVTGNTHPAGGTRDVFLLKYDLAGNPDWDHTWGAAGTSDWGFGVAVSGTEVHVAGHTRMYGGDAMTLKYDTDGVLDTNNSADGWWTLFTGHGPYDGYDYAYDAALDGSGNLHVTGFSEHGYINSWAYVEQYDPAGVKQWHEHYGVPGVHMNTVNYGLALSGHDLYTAGLQHPTGPDEQAFVTKHDVDGTPVWTYLWGSDTGDQRGYDVAVSGSDIYVAGLVGSTYDPNGTDLLLLKLHDDGTSVSFVDSTVFAGSGDDEGLGIDVADGQVFLVGSADVGGHTDAILLAYDTDLNPLWDLSWGSPEDDVAYDITLSDGVIYVTGVMDNKAFINAYIPEPATLSLLAIGGLALLARRRR